MTTTTIEIATTPATALNQKVCLHCQRRFESTNQLKYHYQSVHRQIFKVKHFGAGKFEDHLKLVNIALCRRGNDLHQKSGWKTDLPLWRSVQGYTVF